MYDRHLENIEYPPKHFLPTHHPRGLGEDAFGYSDYADAICEILCNASNKNTGLTIGIFGNWGMGKSSVLRMIKERLEDELHSQFLPVEFSAWRYLRQEDLWLALLRRIIRSVEEDRMLSLWDINKALWETRLETNPVFWKDLRRILTTGLIGGLIAAASFWALLYIMSNPLLSKTAMALARSAGVGVGVFMLNVILATWRTIMALLRGKLDLDIPSLAAPGFDRGAPLRVDDFHRDFETVIKAVRKKKTIVVLIDDLDRCPPDQIVPVLEAIKHFGLEQTLDDKSDADTSETRPGILFVVAADRHAIERAVYGYFKAYFTEKDKPEDIHRFAYEYIEKIVQIQFALPPLSRMDLSKLLGQEIDDQQARAILVQGPLNRPREIKAAYRAFLLHWRILCEKDFHFNPQILAGIVMLKTLWPEDFLRVVDYPEHFFYLVAGATGKSNSICQPTQTRELLDLGLPAQAENSFLQRYHDVYLGRLLKEINLPPGFDVNQLKAYLTLKEEEAVIGTLREHTPEALRSGDPARIQSVKKADANGVEEVYKRFLRELDYWAKNGVNDSDLQKVEALIYAVGLVGDEKAISTFERLRAQKLPFLLQKRIVYALAHLGSTQKIQQAIDLLVEIACDDNQGVKDTPEGCVDIERRVEIACDDNQGVKELAAEMLSYCELKDDQAWKIVSRWYKRVKFADEMILSALRGVKLENSQPEVLLDLCERIKSSSRPWPRHLGDQFISLAVKYKDEPVGKRAFELLASYSDESQVFQWLATLSLQSPAWRHRCWNRMGAIQQLLPEWREKEWGEIFQSLERDNWPDEPVLEFVGAVSLLAREYRQALQLLGELLQCPISQRVKDEIGKHMTEIAEDLSVAENIRESAEEYLRQIEQDAEDAL